MSVKVMTKVWEWSVADGSARLVMLALADFCDDDGVCYPGIKRIAKKCRISERSVQRIIGELEKLGELRREIGEGISVGGDRGPGSTNRYVLQLENRGCQDVTAFPKGVTSEAKGGDTVMSPKSSVEPSVSISKESSDGVEFANWFKKLLPESVKLSGNWKESWAKCYDDLIRLDKRDPEEVRKVCEWARGHDFWSSNFLSPLKLRNRNQDKVTYYDVFKTKLYEQKKPNGHPRAAAASSANSGTSNAAFAHLYK